MVHGLKGRGVTASYWNYYSRANRGAGSGADRRNNFTLGKQTGWVDAL